MASERDPSQNLPHAAAPAPELRLVDRRAFVGFPPLALAPGVVVADFALQIPDVTFPFNLTGGATRYQRRKLGFGLLELSVEADLLARRVAELGGKLAGLEDLKLHFRPGYLEAQARLAAPERTPVTFKVAFDGEGERLAVFLYDVRLYGFSLTPAPQVVPLVSRALQAADLLPGVEVRGASGFSAAVLPALAERAAVSRGFRAPTLDGARLAGAEVSGAGLRLRFAAGGLPPPTPGDEELLLALEGARAFADAEALLADGRLAEAREAYLAQGDVTDAHPFAAERLLALLVADPAAHELALDVAAQLLRRRDRSAAALWAEAVVRERRGEGARAAERFLALSALARKSREDASAFFAAEAAARAAREAAPQVAVRALHELLGIRPDHLPSLQALARASTQARDRAGAVRAYRRLAALARDPAEAADAHVHLAHLCAQTEDDVAGARLHCEAALKLAPDHPEALALLGELAHRSGEHRRALSALDRLREVALGRHELDRVGQANLLAGRVWEEGLEQPENALLRYREAAALLPGDPAPLFSVARVADGLGKLQEALAAYAQGLELAGPAPADEALRRAAHGAHHALARLAQKRLGDPQRAREHLEAALALDPRDALALEQLVPAYRAAGRLPELADALEKAAPLAPTGPARAALLAEAGELARTRLGAPERAERLLTLALEADPTHRGALESLLALAEARRDGPALTRCLAALAALAPTPAERAGLHRRLAVAARDLTGDLELAARALQDVLRDAPDDLPTLGELCAVQRKRGDMPGLALALEARARVAELGEDRRLAAAALRELASVLEARLGRAGEALVALERAARLAPEAPVLSELADLALRLERPAHARRALESLLAALPRAAAPERVAEARARLGRACELLGDREAALDAYAQAFPLRRLDDALAQRLAALYEEAGDARALSALWADRAGALAQDGRHAEAAALWLESARALVAQGEPESAQARAQAALEVQPQGPHAAEALELLAELALARGDRPEAGRALARRAALSATPRERALGLVRASRLAEGTAREEAWLAEALEHAPGLPQARARRGELRLASDPRGALEDLELALAAEGEDAPDAEARRALSRLAARAAARLGRPDAARRHLSAYAALSPADADALGQLADLQREAGEQQGLADTLALLWPRLSGEPRAAARRELAALSLQLGRAPAAADALRSLLAEEPRDAWAAEALLALLPADGQGSAAEEAERLVLLGVLVDAARGDVRAALLARRAALHARGGDVRRAGEDLAEAARLAARPAPHHLALAALAREADEAAEELAHLTRALSADAQAAQPLARERLPLLAQALEARGERAAAQDALRTALALDLPEESRGEACWVLARLAHDAGDAAAEADALAQAARTGAPARRLAARLARAALLEAHGRLEEADQDLEAALALEPHHPPALVALLRVRRLRQAPEAIAALLEREAPHAPPEAAQGLWAELGEVRLEELGDADGAEAALREAVRLSAGDRTSRERLVTLLEARGEARGAATLLEGSAARLPDAEAAPLLREAARLARVGGDADEALRLAREAHARVPATGEALAELAELFHLAGRAEEALPVQEALAETLSFDESPEAAEAALLRVGMLAERSGAPERAEAAYRRVLAHRPLSERAAESLARLLEPAHPREALEVLVAQARALPRSEATAARLGALAARARAHLADVGLAAELLGRAAAAAEAPLAYRRALAALWREEGRAPELLAELGHLAELSLAAGDVGGAAAALAEEARLAEGSGRVEEALRTLEGLRELLAEEGKAAEAAEVERRRAELLRDARLDLSAAAEAFERAYALSGELGTARLGAALAARREDAAAEARWLTRWAALAPEAAERATLQLKLAQLHAAAGRDEAAEDALREALRQDPDATEAERLLAARLEEGGRWAELAQLHEARAQRTQDPKRRAALRLEAARVWEERAGDVPAALAALLAARADVPDDLALTRRVADALHAAGRGEDGAELDALLLAQDPLAEPAWTRHGAFLEAAGEHAALAALLLARAERQPREAAADSLLAAAEALTRGGAPERAALCEARAFERCPSHGGAYARARLRAGDEPRRLADVLALRASALAPEAARPVLRERAERLEAAGEALAAAEAWDAYLALAGDDLDALGRRAELAARASGPAAAQPYDRRLVAAGGGALPVPVRVRAQLRLGHAALGAGAWRDAADALEVVVALEPEGERGREALSLLAEAYTKTGDTRGLYRTSVALAARAGGPDAEALYRRAADLLDAPEDALDALLPLVRLRPADASVVERAAAGLKAADRHAERVEVLAAGARALGGVRAAEWLLEAARTAAEGLADAARADALCVEAAAAAPEHVPALRARVEALRARGDASALQAALAELAPRLADADAAAEVRLELGLLAARAGDVVEARAALAWVVARGPKGTGYAEALAPLEALEEAPEAKAALKRQRAELARGAERAALLADAAALFATAGRQDDALEAARAAAALAADAPTLTLLGRLQRAGGEPARAAAALAQAARLAPEDARAGLFVEAAEGHVLAGEAAQAAELLERALEAGAPAADVARRLLALGEGPRAVEVGFPALKDAGDLEGALALAEAAGDAARAREARWELAAREPAHAAQLAEVLREEWAYEELLALAALVEPRSREEARGLREEVLAAAEAPAAARLDALAALEAQGASEAPLEALVGTLADAPAELVDGVLAHVRRSSRAQTWLARVAEACPARAEPLWREVAALRLAQGDVPQARAAYLHALEAAEGEGQVPALEGLLALTAPGEDARAFAALCERLEAAAGAGALAPWAEGLAEARERLGDLSEAARLLLGLEDTPARLERRARLAERLGRTAEALALRERLAPDAAARAQVLWASLAAELSGPAVRLAERMLEAGELDAAARRRLAERLGARPDGAALAARLWPELLAEAPLDADAWTLYAEALRLLGRDEAAARADGFGAALVSSPDVASARVVARLARAEQAPFRHPLPAGAVQVGPSTLPRLHAALSPALTALGAGGVRLLLHPSGGVEAWLAGPDELVLGAGALAAFGPAELTYLCALALALGERGVALARPFTDVPLADAAHAALEAVPSPLAAGRVLAQLDAGVRGGDPAQVDVGRVLEASGAFRALALAALALV